MDPDPGGQKTCESGGSGSTALVSAISFLLNGEDTFSFSNVITTTGLERKRSKSQIRIRNTAYTM
jgi:hypothetical protein